MIVKKTYEGLEKLWRWRKLMKSKKHMKVKIEYWKKLRKILRKLLKRLRKPMKVPTQWLVYIALVGLNQEVEKLDSWFRPRGIYFKCGFEPRGWKAAIWVQTSVAAQKRDP